MLWFDRRSLCLIAALAIPVSATGDGEPTSQATTSSTSDETLQRWIVQLGSASFRSRRASERRLLELSGSDDSQAQRVKEFLLAAPFPSGDLELDLAKRRLLTAIAQRQAELRMDRFLHDPEFDRGLIVGWEQFRQFAGSGFDSRMVYSEILEHHPTFGHSLAGRPIPNQNARPSDPSGGQPDTLTWFAVLSMACQNPSDRVDEQTMHMVSMLRTPGSGPEPARENERLVCSRLVENYLGRESIDARDRIVIATRYSCRGLVESECRRVLADPSETPARIVIALLAASANGLPGHDMERWIGHYRGDTRVSHVWRSMVPPKTTLRTQVRDVARAIELHRDGIDPRSRGFVALVADPILVFRPYSLGFESETERSKAHAPASAIR